MSQHWCPQCEHALRDDQVVVIPLPAEQGCAGATTLFKIECPCGCDVDVYDGQDRLPDAAKVRP